MTVLCSLILYAIIAFSFSNNYEPYSVVYNDQHFLTISSNVYHDRKKIKSQNRIPLKRVSFHAALNSLTLRARTNRFQIKIYF